MSKFQFWQSGRRREERRTVTKLSSQKSDSDAPIEDFGLFPLEPVGVELDTAASAPLLDIIAVHGLGGHWQKTWTAENGKMWLRDFLPMQLSAVNAKAAVWSYGYNADVALSTAVTNLDDEAEMLLDRIKGERFRPQEMPRPIIFIAHSLGGILVKKAMIRAQERSELYGELLSKIRAIIFLGTPHRGSDVAWWASFPAKLLRALQLGTGTNTAYLDALTRNSKEFSRISQQWVERSKELVIRTFFETARLRGVLVVDKDSAVLNLANETAVGLAGCDHRTMCRFEDANSQRYRPLLNALRQMVGEIRERAMECTVPAISLRSNQDTELPDSWDLKELRSSFMEVIGAFDYVAYWRRNPEREPGTCQWITRHPQFQSWINADNYSILWISGDPGCGKSVAASYLVSHLQETQPSARVAYFFFKDDSDKQSKATSALCSILHQVLLGKQDNVDRAAKKFADQGEDAGSRFFCLWEILFDALTEDSGGSINIVLDALDECDEGERVRLIAGLTELGHRLPLSAGKSVKVIVTSRPYAAIRRSFKDFQVINIHSEDNLDSIDGDVKVVIAARIRRFASSIGIGQEDLLANFRYKLERKADHTFLWISLILDMLDNSDDRTFEEIHQLMDDPNPGVDALYERILEKARNPDKARRMLHIVVGAVEPLTLEELDTAWAVKIGHKLTEEQLQNRKFLCPKVGVRETCGLFVRVVQGKVVLVHQTAREFLVRALENSIPPAVGPAKPTRWKWSLDSKESTDMLAGICATYLMSIVVKPRFEHPPEIDLEVGFLLSRYPFLRHATSHLLKYAEGLSGKSQFVELCIELFTTPVDYAFWFALRNRVVHKRQASRSPPPPLFLCLVMSNSADIIRWLVARGQDVNAAQHQGKTVLQSAVSHGNVTAATNLLRFNADPNKDPANQGSALHIAVRLNNVEMARLLLSHGADRLSQDWSGAIPIHWVHSPEMVNLLLEDRSTEQLRSFEFSGSPTWLVILKDNNLPTIIPTFAALISAVPEELLEQFKKYVSPENPKFVQAFEEPVEFLYLGIMVSMSGPPFSSFMESGILAEVMRIIGSRLTESVEAQQPGD